MTKAHRDWIYLATTRIKPLRLSPRQQQILNLIAEGYRTADIAHELALKPETVNQHIGKIRKKLNAKTNAHAVAIGIKNIWYL